MPFERTREMPVSSQRQKSDAPVEQKSDATKTGLAVLARHLTERKEGSDEGRIFYMSIPNEDGSFNASSASPTYKEGASIYKFRMMTNDFAKFEIDTHEVAVKLALRNTPRGVDPVCQAENPFHSNASQIQTLSSGEVRLNADGDKWVVSKKARVRYSPDHVAKQPENEYKKILHEVSASF